MLDDDDWTLLNEAAASEKLSKSDIVRRALRRYASELQSQDIPQPQPAPTAVTA